MSINNFTDNAVKLLTEGGYLTQAGHPIEVKYQYEFRSVRSMVTTITHTIYRKFITLVWQVNNDSNFQWKPGL